MGIEGIPDFIRRGATLQVQMGDLPQSMDPRIRSARTLNSNGLAAKAVDGTLQRRLNRRAIVLALPPHKGAAVIFNRELVPSCHRACFQSGHAGTRGNGRATEECIRRARCLASPLDLGDGQRPFTARDRQPRADQGSRYTGKRHRLG